jgi:hypothetical protein
MPLPTSAPPTAASIVAGGQTSKSQRGEPTCPRAASALAKAIPSARSPFIFQLPATSFLNAITFPQAAPATQLRRHGAVFIIAAHDHTGARPGQL